MTKSPQTSQEEILLGEAAVELRSICQSGQKLTASLPISSIPCLDESSQSSEDEDTTGTTTLASRINRTNTRESEKRIQSIQESDSGQTPFPHACLKLVLNLPGNNRCVDCGEAHPQWASVSYGVLLCLVCSGRHRSFGVSVSKVQSIMMDSWSHSQILSMLEGGNKQLETFFERHSLAPGQSQSAPSEYPLSRSSYVTASVRLIDAVVDKRYRTKAAQFYREQLAVHVTRIVGNGEYQGREASRRKVSNVNNNKTHSVSNSTLKSSASL